MAKKLRNTDFKVEGYSALKIPDPNKPGTTLKVARCEICLEIVKNTCESRLKSHK